LNLKGPTSKGRRREGNGGEREGRGRKRRGGEGAGKGEALRHFSSYNLTTGHIGFDTQTLSRHVAYAQATCRLFVHVGLG